MSPRLHPVLGTFVDALHRRLRIFGMAHSRCLALVLISAVCASIALTAPHLLSAIRIGLEFRGGSEILYVAAPTQRSAGDGVSAAPSRADLLSAARELGLRANAMGVSEPEIRVESPAQIR